MKVQGEAAHANMKRLTTHALGSLVVIVCAALAVTPVIIGGVPAGADLEYHLRFASCYHEALRAGDLGPGWLPEANLGYGDVYLRFYPPALSYLLAAARAILGDWHAATTLTLTAITMVGALGAYAWATSLSASRRAAVCAGVLYAFAPYRLTEIYQASLLAEYAAGAALPFSFFFAERLNRKRSWFDAAGLAAAHSALILTHLPQAIIGTAALCLYVLLLQRRRELSGGRVGAFLVAGGLAAAATSFYWTTVVVELPWIHNSYLPQDPYYDYRLNFLFSPFAVTNLNTWFANAIGLATLGCCLPAIVLLSSGRRPTANHRSLWAAIVVFFFALLMVTDLSRPLWRTIPKLPEVQFPFRWLSVVSLAGAGVVAQSAFYWTEKARGRRWRPLDSLVVGGFLLASSFTLHQVVLRATYLSGPELEDKRATSLSAVNFKKWLPVWAEEMGKINYFAARVDAGARSVAVDVWAPERRRFAVGAAEEPTDVRVHTFYYPHWAAEARGQSLPVKPAADGTLTVTAPAAPVSVDLFFREPPRVYVFRIVSCAAWLVILCLLVAGAYLRRRQNSDEAPLILKAG